MAEWSFTLGSFAFNVVDVVIIALAFMSAIAGAVRGFALEFSARAGFLVGFVVALIFSQLGANLVGDTFDVPPLIATLIAFVILFIIGYVAMMLVGSLLDKTLDALGLDWLDRLLGLFLGVIEVGVVVAFVVYILELQQVIDLSTYIDPSVITTRLIKPLTPVGLDLVKGIV